ncbi:MAG: Maf family nucleotide pyrophosphatase [Flavobacteriales bacterium]|nr:Maf family nucleotide pyrophosphatase [Flavobacteriales bacterium]
MLNLQGKQLILASASPRRKWLMEELGLEFSIQPKNVEEVYPDDLEREEIPLYLSKLKANAFSEDELEGKIILTADTIVWLNDKELQKPVDLEDAKRMIRQLSGTTHEVYTAITVRTSSKTISDFDRTEVHFRELTEDEIEFYVQKYKPLDKAGAYGIQEWIGYVGIDRIFGCYFNVMGLPLRKVYAALNSLSA